MPQEVLKVEALNSWPGRSCHRRQPRRKVERAVEGAELRPVGSEGNNITGRALSPLLARRGRLRQEENREASDAAQTGWWFKLSLKTLVEIEPPPRSLDWLLRAFT